MKFLYLRLFPRKLAKFIIIIYQKTISFDHSFLGKIIKPQGQCLFRPTCSDYALQALERYGFFMGLFLAFKRVIRCHPWSRGGYDPLK
ncbi:MAG TPA: membrane protein insertion efficiency factor YidD [bacterium]|nr:membrane protein insertion efficiency factor YidD [bacterium]